MINGKLIYTVEGVGSLTFGCDAPFYLEKFDGMSLGATKIANTAVGLAGQKTIRTTFNARTISCELAVSGVDSDNRYNYTLYDQRKQEIARILNPMYKGTLTRINRYGTYTIEASPSEIPIFEKFVGATAKFKVNFIADNPYWHSTQVKTYHIGGEFGNTLTIFNTSGTELPFVFSGTALKGNNNVLFKITNNDTGEAIELADTIRIYDTEFKLNTETCETFLKAENDSDTYAGDFIFTFSSAIDMTLKPGQNEFTLTAQNTEQVFTIEVTDLFVGVA